MPPTGTATAAILLHDSIIGNSNLDMFDGSSDSSSSSGGGGGSSGSLSRVASAGKLAFFGSAEAVRAAALAPVSIIARCSPAPISDVEHRIVFDWVIRRRIRHFINRCA